MRPALSFVQGAFPIKLLYTSVLPLIVLSAFQGVVYLTSQVSSREPPPTPTLRIDNSPASHRPCT